MTVNAKLPKTPQSPAAGASDLAVDSLDNNIPIGRARNRAARPAQILKIKWRTTRKVSRRRSAKRRIGSRGALPRKWAAEYSTDPSLSRPPPHRRLRKQFNTLLCSWLLISRSAPPRTRQISRACGDCRSRIPLNVVERETFLGPLWRAQMTHSARAVCAHGRSAA